MARAYKLAELGLNDCRFPVTPHSAVSHRFCGKRAVQGTPYCEAHCKVAYLGTPKKSENGFIIFKRRKAA